MEIGRAVSTFYAENDTQLIQLNKQTSEFAKLKVNNFGSLNEDLANISHICCDKTGTLTKNELIFRQLSLVIAYDYNNKSAITKVFKSTDYKCTNLSGQLKAYAANENMQ